MKLTRNKQIIFFVVAIILIIVLFLGAMIRTDIYNKTERSYSISGDKLNNLPDYSGLEISYDKTPGGWSSNINGRDFDAYTLELSVSNSTGEEISDYRVRFDVNDDVYFITAWCGTIEFHQTNSEGEEVCQTIDLRNRPDAYLVDTIDSGDSPIIPLHKGDWFIYIPSTVDGEAPIANEGTVVPCIMYYEPTDATDDVFTFIPSEKNDENADNDVSMNLVARSSTWTKIFDLENTGTTTPDYQAYTYDLTITNNSDAILSDFEIKVCFGTEVYMAQAWNGYVTINQGSTSDYIEDLRNFDASKLSVMTINVDGEDFVYLDSKDYLIYSPNTSVNYAEIPIESGEASVPGFILYMKIGDSISNAEIDLTYKLHRAVSSSSLFKIAIGISVITLIAAIVCIAMALQRRRFEEIHKHDSKIIRESIETFTGFIDAKDPYTNGHSRRVAEYTKLMASKMGYEGEELEKIYYIALLHDCGKIGISDSILGKPGKLTDEEFTEIKKHASLGGEILKNFKSIEGVTEGAMYHHERYDGKGYPEGRSGKEIPEIARIICVADSFDAMNSNRCYRNKLNRETIIEEIENNKGKQFDPDIADVMLELIENHEVIL